MRKRKLARVFATKTKMCPNDLDVYFSEPDLFTPKYDEVHISVTFTWGIKSGHKLRGAWKQVCDDVKIGGPAFGDSGGNFISGMYLKKGLTITSRGCPLNCPFCFVPKREGKIRELPIVAGNIVQDNNLLACSNRHIDQVFQMLKHQRRIDFPGGLECARITDSIIDKLRGLRIYQIWVSYDLIGNTVYFEKAVKKLRKHFKRDKIRCYVLIGFWGDTLQKAEDRLRYAWSVGTLPFAMRYRTPSLDWQNTYIYKEREWNLLQRKWTRPAITKSIMK